jgi:spore germination protein GerM
VTPFQYFATSTGRWVGIALALAVTIAVIVIAFSLDRRDIEPLAFRLDLADRGVALQTTTVYFLAADSLRLVADTREVPPGGDRSQLAQELVAHLAEAPENRRAPLPEGTALLHYFETGTGEAVLDFNARVTAIAGRGILEERMRLDALARTMTESLPGVERLKLLVHGRPLERWGEHVELGPTVEANAP